MRRADDSFERRRPRASSPEVRKRMQATRRRDTPPELAIRSRLENLGLAFAADRSPIPGTRRRADFVFPEAKVAIYVDGCFWHGCPEHGTFPKRNSDWWREKIERNRERDADTNRLLTEQGWMVVRIWEHEAPERAVEAILEAIYGRSNQSGCHSPRSLGDSASSTD
ncbi:MAG TPA: very short patch repair endonuclease [Candidatus Dormibacteraeota bacterium]|nr:very short patch repair endonuclease [Candidatus Dormibacteraeota bacterium]